MRGIEQFVQVDAATLGALKYAGTWNASTNTPTLASGVGVQGQYYVVSVAGSTNLDGVTNWGVGDWAVFNGSVWQRVEGGADGNFVNLSVTGTASVSGTAEFADGLAASPSITNIGDTNTGMYFPSADAIGIVTGGVNRMRFTSAGDVGIGTTTPSSKLDVNGTVTATAATVTGNAFLATTSGDVGIGTSTPLGKVGVNNPGTGQVGFNGGTVSSPNRGNLFYDTDGTGWDFRIGKLQAGVFTPQLTIKDSGDVGIGTSSPAAKLEVFGGDVRSALVGASSATLRGLSIASDSTEFSSLKAEASTGETRLTSGFAGFGGHSTFYTNGTERMRIDSSGNLGLGVTPSAWKGDQRVLQIGASASLQSNTSVSNLIANSNTYFDSGAVYRYIANGFATQYEQYLGLHKWYTAPSGTAGNAISFTQAMTLDASGYLVVGDTNTNARFKAALTGASTASITTVTDFGAAGVLSLGGIGSNSQGVYLGTGDARTGINSNIAAGIGFLREASGWNSALAFYTNNTTDGVTTNRITERARIPAAGGMVVGTAAIATNATDGFLYVPTCAGTPTGTPTTQTGTAPIVIDTTNNKLYFYSGGQWRDAGP